MRRLAFVVLLSASVPAQPAGTNYDEAKVPVYRLPDLLVSNDGRAVRNAGDWVRRRGEIRSLLESQMFGRLPSPRLGDDRVIAGTAIDRSALGGLAVRKEVAIKIDGLALNLLVYLPAKATRPAPVFVGLGFGPNQTVSADPGVRLQGSWTRDKATGTIRLVPGQESSRGAAASRWQLGTLLARGYGLATLYYGDVEPDIPGALELGIRGRGLKTGQEAPAPDEWGAIAAWAWALGVAADYLSTDQAVDAKRLAVVGHSRLGKAALWAGARDERFALVISNDSGEGGAAISRRCYGETVENLNTAFPHWFCARYRQYNGREADMPFDSHMLLALVAPRPLYVASAEDDRWADPKGEFLGAIAASQVWELLGHKGVGTTVMPPVNRPVGDTVRYHQRTGPHDITAYDWEQFLDFADRQFAATR